MAIASKNECNIKGMLHPAGVGWQGVEVCQKLRLDAEQGIVTDGGVTPVENMGGQHLKAGCGDAEMQMRRAFQT